MPLRIVTTVVDLRECLTAWRGEGHQIGLVPTMGALHDGHLSLVRLARTRASRIVASIFVNPTQFAPGEDFEAYPRDAQTDAALLEDAGCDLLYLPDAREIYPQGFATTVTVAGPADTLDGIARPGHFAGVATVVAKLLLQSAPDVAVFGEKDYQQLQVIRRLVTDLDLAVEIVGAPTAREADGLAMSSRNAYLSAAERKVAGQLNLILIDAIGRLRAGTPVGRVEATAVAALERAGFDTIDYVAVRRPDDLSPLPDGPLTGDARILTAARLGRTRLIDNMAV